ncbi:unnamed protein product [Penicillium pancosmium]
MNEPNDQWPFIPEDYFITRPIRTAFPQQSLGVLSPEEAMRQIYRNGLIGCGFQRPGHFSDPGFIHCEPIPVTYWLENMPLLDLSNLSVCGCRQQLVPQRTKQCLFADLDDSKRYYAMVSLNERSALYGLIPEPIIP